VQLSEKFFGALAGSGKKYYRIAWEAGLKPNQLYKITSGIDHPDREDPRIQKLCAFLGLSIDDAFDLESTEDKSRAHA